MINILLTCSKHIGCKLTLAEGFLKFPCEFLHSCESGFVEVAVKEQTSSQSFSSKGTCVNCGG